MCFFIAWKNFLLNSLFEPFSPFLKCFVLALMLNLLSTEFICMCGAGTGLQSLRCVSIWYQQQPRVVGLF